MQCRSTCTFLRRSWPNKIDTVMGWVLLSQPLYLPEKVVTNDAKTSYNGDLKMSQHLYLPEKVVTEEVDLKGTALQIPSQHLYLPEKVVTNIESLVREIADLSQHLYLPEKVVTQHISNSITPRPAITPASPIGQPPAYPSNASSKTEWCRQFLATNPSATFAD